MFWINSHSSLWLRLCRHSSSDMTGNWTVLLQLQNLSLCYRPFGVRGTVSTVVKRCGLTKLFVSSQKTCIILSTLKTKLTLKYKFWGASSPLCCQLTREIKCYVCKPSNTTLFLVVCIATLGHSYMFRPSNWPFSGCTWETYQ